MPRKHKSRGRQKPSTQQRKRAPTYEYSGPHRLWTEEEAALLGTATDREVGELIGRTAKAVRDKREKLGIEPFVKRKKWTKKETWNLATATDREVGEKLKRTRRAVTLKRQRLGIKAKVDQE